LRYAPGRKRVKIKILTGGRILGRWPYGLGGAAGRWRGGARRAARRGGGGRRGGRAAGTAHGRNQLACRRKMRPLSNGSKKKRTLVKRGDRPLVRWEGGEDLAVLGAPRPAARPLPVRAATALVRSVSFGVGVGGHGGGLRGDGDVAGLRGEGSDWDLALEEVLALMEGVRERWRMVRRP
jgi:hypothetical protein